MAEYQRFFEAADALAAEGVKPTLRAVMDRAGGGSMRDICAAMQQWRQRKQRIPVPASEPPETLAVAIKDIWQAALAQAFATIEHERRALAQASAAQQDEVEEIKELAEQIERERDALAAELESAKQARDAAEERARVLQAEVDALKGLCEQKLADMVERARIRKAEPSQAKPA